MPIRIDSTLAQTSAIIQFNGAGTQYIVQTPSGVLYIIYGDSGSDVAFKKSTNGGLSWTKGAVIFTGTVVSMSVWYDRWSGISGDLIHVAYTESGTHDTLYRTINTASSDSLSTQTVIFAGASAVATGSSLSIVRARGGNVYCRTQIDAGAEGGFYRLPNANVPAGAWDAARTNNEALATLDMIILTPGFAADDQDIMAIFWDASANEISRYVYDDSANSWAETSIATSMTEVSPASSFPHFDMAVDLANSQIVMVAWSGVDTANADLRCWTITESAITEKTNVVLNSTDDQGLASICLNLQTGEWLVFYAGKSDGSETWSTSLNIYYKGSRDSGSTWGPETLLTNRTHNTCWMITCPRLYLGQPIIAYHDNQTIDEIMVNIGIMQPRTSNNLGI